MQDNYLDILKEWEDNVADPAVYEKIDVLFPGYGFRRKYPGAKNDRWVSRLKMDLSQPKTPNPEKTVVSRMSMSFQEQGEWGRGVGIMDMIMRSFGISSIYDAYKYVSERLGLMMPERDSASVRKHLGEMERKRALLRNLQDYFVWNIENNSKSDGAGRVRDYLQGRGFSKEDVKTAGFGFVPSWKSVIARMASLKDGFTESELDAVCGVRAENGYTSVGKEHILSIPYICGGELKGFLFRRIADGQGPKYKASTGLDRKSVFFHIPERVDGELLIVEGEIDAINASLAGVHAVAAIGGSHLSGERRAMVEDAFRRGTDSITICLDLDEKDGVVNAEKNFEMNMKTIHTIHDVDPDFHAIKVAVFHEASDPDEYIRAHGKAAFMELIRRAEPYWRYLYYYKEGLIVQKR